MNEDATNGTTNWSATLENEATLDTTFFDAAPTSTSATATTATNAATAATAADDAVATSSIAPDTHFLSSALKLDTEIFSKTNIKNMADKDAIDTTPDPDAPIADTPDADAQDSGSTDSNSPYSLRNRKFAPYSPPTP